MRNFAQTLLAVFATIFTLGLLAADSPPDKKSQPISSQLLNEISKSPYIDESVQTTNGDPVGMVADTVFDWNSGQARFAVVQLFDNIDLAKRFTAIPWQLVQFDPQDRRLEVRASLEQLRNAPKLRLEEVRQWAISGDTSQIYAHFGVDATGGGSVAGTMGTETGSGSSFARVPTNDAQPQRGSVAVMYIAGALVIGVLAGRYLFNRRA